MTSPIGAASSVCERVHPGVRNVRRRQGATHQGVERRLDRTEDSSLAHHFERARRTFRLQGLHPLVAHPLGGHFLERREVRSDRGTRHGVEIELERCDEARGPQHAQSVLGEALVRIAHRADQARAQVRDAIERIDEQLPHRIERDRVDGEIAPRQVLAHVADEVHRVRTPSVAVGRLAAKRRHLVAGLPDQAPSRCRAGHRSGSPCGRSSSPAAATPTCRCPSRKPRGPSDGRARTHQRPTLRDLALRVDGRRRALPWGSARGRRSFAASSRDAIH